MWVLMRIQLWGTSMLNFCGWYIQSRKFVAITHQHVTPYQILIDMSKFVSQKGHKTINLIKIATKIFLSSEYFWKCIFRSYNTIGMEVSRYLWLSAMCWRFAAINDQLSQYRHYSHFFTTFIRSMWVLMIGYSSGVPPCWNFVDISRVEHLWL